MSHKGISFYCVLCCFFEGVCGFLEFRGDWVGGLVDKGEGVRFRGNLSLQLITKGESIPVSIYPGP